MMHAETFALLRHIEVHGPRTRPEVAGGLSRPVLDVTKTINNLVMMGYLARDESTTPICYSLTKKARKKLSEPFTPAPKSTKPRKKRETPDTPAVDAVNRALRHRIREQAQITHERRGARALKESRTYQSTEYGESSRPGAMQAFALPSRFGDRLHYRDGRATDMQGNPLTQPTALDGATSSQEKR